MSENFKNYIAGERIYLREVQIEDANDNYCRWMNDPEVTRFTESRFSDYTIEKLKDYIRYITSNNDNIFFAIVLKDNNTHIGNIKIGSINWIHRFSETGLIIGEKKCWGKGYATEAIKLACEYAFRQVDLHKLLAGCYINNKGSIRAFEKAGFTLEGTLKKHFLYKGEYIDSVILSKIQNPEFKPL